MEDGTQDGGVFTFTRKEKEDGARRTSEDASMPTEDGKTGEDDRGRTGHWERPKELMLHD